MFQVQGHSGCCKDRRIERRNYPPLDAERNLALMAWEDLWLNYTLCERLEQRSIVSKFGTNPEASRKLIILR